MDTTRTLGIAALLFGGIWMAMKAFQKDDNPEVVYIPPPPPPPSQGGSWQQYVAWAQMAAGLVDDIADLWGPGGPFYGQSTSTVYDYVPDEVLDEWNWNDPNDYPQGWV